MVGVLTLALTANSVSAEAVDWWRPADPRVWSPRPLEPTASVGGRDAIPPNVVPLQGDQALPWQPEAVAWPQAGASTLTLTSRRPSSEHADVVSPFAAEASVGEAAKAPDLPVWVAAGASTPTNSARVEASGQVRVTLADRPSSERAGVQGMLVSVGTQDRGGAATVGIDYSSIRGAFDGSWAARLRLVTLPACAMTTPDVPACRVQTPVPTSRNDLAAGRITGEIELATGMNGAAGAPTDPQTAVVLAAVAGAAGPTGDYRATSLSPTGSWSVGGNSGSFSWTYPIVMPPALGDAPDIELSYSSGSVDGRTAAKNAQASWIGDGWDYDPGFIERSYQACTDDGQTDTGESCWSTKQQVTMSLNGRSTTLIKDDATGVWHAEDQDRARIELVTGGGNGDNDGEYWKVTTTDGTQYFFGRHNKPVGPAGPVTNSAWTRPVYGNNPGEPCYNADFAQAWCQQAWRWNLDHAIDVRGNLVTYSYTPETNYYARNPDTAHPDGVLTQYTRGGVPAKITYGSQATDTTGPTAQVVFTTAERCLPKTGVTCAPETLNASTAANWPDVPYNLNCGASGACANNTASFWSTKRLTKITTQVLNGAAATTVDEWVLEHEFPNPGDGSGPTLWLKSLTRTGYDGSNKITTPSVDFVGEFRNNRVDAAGDNAPPLNRRRITGITTETGNQIGVRYADPDCTPTTLPAPDANGQRCYPVWWNYDDKTESVKHWFHKYVVAEVTETDPTTGTPQRSKRYEYVGAAAWHRDDSELTEAKHRTWDEFRGYQTVVVRTGRAPDPVTRTVSTYLRGMDGDYKADGTRRTITVADSQGGTITDSGVLSGFERETVYFTADGGRAVTSTVNTPWIAPVSATHIRGAGLPNLTAQTYKTGRVSTKSEKADGNWWGTYKTTTYDPYHAVPLTVSDQADGLPETCTTTTYAHNTALNILALPVEEFSVTGACGTAPGAGTTISHTRKLYDDLPFGQVGGYGEVTTAQTVDAYTGSTPSHTVDTRTGYDAYGRATSTTDELGNTTTTAYTPAGGRMPTEVKVTNPAGHSTVTAFSGPRNLETKTTDANGRVIEQSYDPLGRRTAVWVPGRNRAANETASLQFTYTLSKTAPTVITTKTLRASGTYASRIQFLDSFLNERQVQESEKNGGSGRLITDTAYNSHGNVVKTSLAYYNSAAPSTTRFIANDNEIPGQNGVFYDGIGRKTAETFSSKAIEQWRTTTTYRGADRTDILPPHGGTPTTTFSDARGKVRELRQYKVANPNDSSPYDAVLYGYDARGQLKTATDPHGNTWTYDYDLLGRQTRAVDPDRGTTTTGYDARGQATSTTDARGQTVVTTYDSLGRRTATYAGTNAPANQLTSWAYDTKAKGQLDQSIRYVGGASGAQYKNEVTGYDIGYRPTGTRVTIPAAEGKLQGVYENSTVYEPIEGLAYSKTLPQAGDLAAETVYYAYNGGGQTVSVGGRDTYVNWTDYDPFGRPLRVTYGTVPKQVVFTTDYDQATGRVLRTFLDKQTGTTASVDAARYTYKPSGDITSISTTRDGAATDTQCFTYDYMRRLTEAWTDTGTTATLPGPSVPGIGGCTNATPSTTSLGGPAPYWQTYTYDSTGNRTQLVDHNPAGTGDTTTTYTAPATGQPRPHTVSTATVASPTGTTNLAWGYDDAGNTTTRPSGDGGTQTLTWDTEGHLAADITTHPGLSKTSTYLYDADGQRLIRRAPDSTTLYTGTDEITLTLADQKVTGTRVYDTPEDSPTVLRTEGTKVSYQAADHNGTGLTTLDAATLTTIRRAFKPYGETRGTAPTPGTWPGEFGYVGGTDDTATGLVHLGAREYDAALGRFISVDPVMDLARSQQMHGYLYAGGSPVTNSDPTGLDYCPSDLCNHYDPNILAEIRYTTVEEATHAVTSTRQQEAALGIPYKPSTITYRPPPPPQDPPKPPAAPKPPKPKKCGKWDVKCKAKNAVNKVVDKAKDEIQEWKDDWKHKLINFGVTAVAAFGTAACIASAVCGMGLFMVGAAATFAGGLSAHYAISSPEERREGMGRHVWSTARSVAMGAAGGTLWGRGPIGGIVRGVQEKWIPRATSWGGRPPLLTGVPRGGWTQKVVDTIRRL